MCRFLVVKSSQKQNHQKLINQFSLMCQKSKTLDGDWQGDGWGLVWLDQENNWQRYRSLKPVWKDKENQKVPETNMLMVHARSATFKTQLGNLSFNQPYIKNKSAFVFNGHVRGVRLNQKVAGKVGAEKIFNLILRQNSHSPAKAIKKVHQLINSKAEQIHGFNLGLTDKKYFYVFSDFTEGEEYFSIRSYNSKKLKMICSEEFGSFNWKKVIRNKVICQ